MLIEEIRKELFLSKDEKYGEFQRKLIPTLQPDTIIGVRTPELRKMAKKIAKMEEVSDFTEQLPHDYFEENQLHAFIISENKDYDSCICRLNHFLPYVDNWATCDQMSPGIFKKHKSGLLPQVRTWLTCEHTYTIRFGVKMLMDHFLEEDFLPHYPRWILEIKTEEYYVKMAMAWYFATALAKQHEAVLPIIEEKKLDVWTHNKAIQKAVESYRISTEKKEYLKQLKQHA